MSSPPLVSTIRVEAGGGYDKGGETESHPHGLIGMGSGAIAARLRAAQGAVAGVTGGVFAAIQRVGEAFPRLRNFVLRYICGSADKVACMIGQRVEIFSNSFGRCIHFFGLFVGLCFGEKVVIKNFRVDRRLSFPAWEHAWRAGFFRAASEFLFWWRHFVWRHRAR